MGLATESYDADVALRHDVGNLSPEAMTRSQWVLINTGFWAIEAQSYQR